jgi:hypothetical protein
MQWIHVSVSTSLPQKENEILFNEFTTSIPKSSFFTLPSHQTPKSHRIGNPSKLNLLPKTARQQTHAHSKLAFKSRGSFLYAKGEAFMPARGECCTYFSYASNHIPLCTNSATTSNGIFTQNPSNWCPTLETGAMDAKTFEMPRDYCNANQYQC